MKYVDEEDSIQDNKYGPPEKYKKISGYLVNIPIAVIYKWFRFLNRRKRDVSK